MTKTRSAKFLATLVYFDGPQLVLLESGKTKLIATAVPSKTGTRFAAVTVRKQDLTDYFNETVDLRFLFAYPKTRIRYYVEIKDVEKTLKLERRDNEFPDQHLPEKGFFASDHSEEYVEEAHSGDIALLSLAGQWELSEFGSFHQKFSDIYAFASSLRSVANKATPQKVHEAIKSAFLGKPLRGGSSYQGLFSHLGRHVPQQDRLRLNKIRKASPGKMEMLGDDALFDDVKALVNHFRLERPKISEEYSSFYAFLQKNGYLRMPVDRYSVNDQNNAEILTRSKKLSDLLGFDDFDSVKSLCEHNALKVAKVILALHRRIEGAALYFAQGRVEFDDGEFHSDFAA